jgi:hypothetical protein
VPESGIPVDGVPDGVDVADGLGVAVGSALAKLATPTAAPNAVTPTAAEAIKAFLDRDTSPLPLLCCRLYGRLLVTVEASPTSWQAAGNRLAGHFESSV